MNSLMRQKLLTHQKKLRKYQKDLQILNITFEREDGIREIPAKDFIQMYAPYNEMSAIYTKGKSGDNLYGKLIQGVTIRLYYKKYGGNYHTQLNIPAGYTWDFASIPTIFQGILNLTPDAEELVISSLAHDFLYEFMSDLGLSREFSDLVFYELTDLGFETFKDPNLNPTYEAIRDYILPRLTYSGVRVGGQVYTAHRASKKKNKKLHTFFWGALKKILGA